MADNISMTTGQAAFFGTEPAWHKLGTIVEGARNWVEAMILAQLDWKVSKQQLLSPIDAELVSAWGIFRDDNNQMIGAVGSSYTPIQNEFAFNFVDTLMEQEEGCHYVSAGALGNGEVIWCLAEIGKGFEVVAGDTNKNYLLFTTSHDGSKSATCKLTTVRVVCQNTLNQALNMKGESTRVKHTKNAEVKLNSAKELITNAQVGIMELEQKLRELSKRKVNKQTLSDIMKKLYGDFDESKRSENKVAEILDLYERNDNNQFKEIRGTAYNLLNSITEYTDHYAGIRTTAGRKGRSESVIRAENAMFGTGSDKKYDALSIIEELTRGSERLPEKTHFIMSSGTTGSEMLDSLVHFN